MGEKSKKEKFHSLIDKVWNWRNLNEAWDKVKSNKGAGGIDKVSIEQFERNREQNLNEIQRLNPTVIGWGNYYKIAKVKTLYKGLDGWTRMRLRAFKEKKKSHLSNRRITNAFLSNQGLKSLSSLLNP